MYDLTMLNVEVDRCRGELKALETQVELAAASKPVDMVGSRADRPGPLANSRSISML